jgi:hypothetical protein
LIRVVSDGVSCTLEWYAHTSPLLSLARGCKNLNGAQVEIRYLFRLPVSRSVHANFMRSPKGQKIVDVGSLLFHTNPHPSEQEKKMFEGRRKELMEWRARGGKPPVNVRSEYLRRSPKAR